MRRRPLLPAIVGASALFVLTAAGCGGPGLPGTGAISNGGGIDGSGLVVGPIQGLAPVVVHGIVFDVSTASVRLDGIQGSSQDLRLGMVVTVRGSIPYDASLTGVATSVEFQDEVEGPVQSIDVGGAGFVAMGRRVRVDTGTVFDNTTLASLAVGDIVEVSGFPDSLSAILATRVERRNEPQGTVEVSGFITELDTVRRRFALGSLEVDYSAAAVRNEPLSGLVDGLRVEVRSAQAPVENLLAVSVVEVETGSSASQGEELELEGLVTAVLSPKQFVMNATQQVRTDSRTVFEHGSLTDLVINRRLKADGVLDADGILVAEKLEFAERR